MPFPIWTLPTDGGDCDDWQLLLSIVSTVLHAKIFRNTIYQQKKSKHINIYVMIHGTLQYNCSSQHWSASDLTSCSGALHANSTILQFVTDLIFVHWACNFWCRYLSFHCCHMYIVLFLFFYTFSCRCSCHSWHDGLHWRRYNNNTIGITYYSHHTLLHGA